MPGLLVNMLVSIISMSVFAIHKGIIRYSELKDIIRIIKFAFLQFAIWTVAFSTDVNRIFIGSVTLPMLLVNMFVVIFLLAALRLVVKEVYFRAISGPVDSSNKTLIFGA